MKREIFITLILLITTLFIVGCSSGSINPMQPDKNPYLELNVPVVQTDNTDTGRNMLGYWNLEFDPDSLSVKVQSNRMLANHFSVAGYIPAPSVWVAGFDPITCILDLDVTITNTLPVDGYDMRLILFTNDEGVMLRNPDDWTALWDIPGGSQINPFKAYAKVEDSRIFESQMQHTERVQIYLPGNLKNVNFAIDASYPGNCDEPYLIENFAQNRLKVEAGSVALAAVDVCDWQDDVDAVALYCPSITGQSLVEFSPYRSNTWLVTLVNNTGAPAGVYTGVVVASSANSGQVNLYDFIKITVSETVVAEWTILSYIYQENLGYLFNNINEMEVAGSEEGVLNMIVCMDITDTPNDLLLYIEKDPDGYNNRIISPQIEDFGEVIPPEGLDMPNPEQLTKFLRFAIREFPAKKYAYIMMSHGNYGIYYHVPERSFLDDMGVWEFRDAVLEALNEFGIDRLDFVGLENCTMSFIEMANCMRDCAKVTSASEYLMYVYSAQYDEVLTEVLNNPEMTGHDLGGLFASNTIDNGGALIYSVWDADTVRERCIPAVNVLAQALMDYLPTHRVEIEDCRLASDNWGNECEDYRITDLGYFCQNLIEYDPPLPQPLTDAAQSMIDEINNAIYYLGKDYVAPGCFRSGYGWQILFTDQFNNPDEEYQYKVRDVIQNIGFADATLWDEFLMMYDDHDW